MAKILRADASAASAWVELDLGSNEPEVWVTFKLRFDAAALALWTGSASGWFAQLFDPTHSFADDFLLIQGGQWQDALEIGGTPVADTWILCELRYVLDNGFGDIICEFFVDGSLLFSNTFPTFAGGEARYVRIGNDASPADPASVAYFDDILVGTTRGGSDLFADDFEDGTLAAWTSTSGDVSVIDDPYAPPPAPDVRFWEGAPWRFAVLDAATFQTITILDRVASQRSVHLRLNAPATAAGVVPSDDPEVNIAHTDDEPFLAEGTRILAGFRREGGTPPWVCRYMGVILQIQDTAVGDRLTSAYTAFDAWQELYKRPCRNGAGGLPGVNGLSFSGTDWDVVIATLLANTIAEDGPCRIDAGETYGGTAFYGGTVETVDAGAADFGVIQGTSVGEAWAQIVALGVADIVLTPIYDPANRPGYTHELNVYAQAGQVRNEALLRLGDTVSQMGRLEDGTQRANRIYAYAGSARTLTSGSPHDDSASITKYGVQIDQFFFPGQNVGGAVDALAEWQLLLRANGKTLVTCSPLPERGPLPFTGYYLGDRLPVWADRRFRKPIVGNSEDGYLRVYGIPLDISDDSIEVVSDLLLVAGA